MSEYIAIVLFALCVFCLALLSGCSISTLRDAQTGLEVSRYSFGTNLNVMHGEARVTPGGSREIIINGGDSEQTEALKAITEGAVRGAVKAAAP